jgi:hypothetical protein
MGKVFVGGILKQKRILKRLWRIYTFKTFICGQGFFSYLLSKYVTKLVKLGPSEIGLKKALQNFNFFSLQRLENRKFWVVNC